jgi:hypothetical protein
MASARQRTRNLGRLKGNVPGRIVARVELVWHPWELESFDARTEE